MTYERAGDSLSLESRARQSRGSSDDAIHRMVAETLSELGAVGRLVDVGCGTGGLKPFVQDLCSSYVGVDAVRFEGYPTDAEFLRADLDRNRIPLSDDSADVVVAAETIEHLENPRAFMRELVRVAKPGAWIAVTTPNILSLLSLGTLLAKKRFSYFQDSDYPAHITPLLEVDLRRIAAECGLEKVSVRYSFHGRIALTPWHYPRRLARIFPRALSDNLLLSGKKR